MINIVKYINYDVYLFNNHSSISTGCFFIFYSIADALLRSFIALKIFA